MENYYDRLLRFIRSSRWCLAGIVGLTFVNVSNAQVSKPYASSTAAYNACLQDVADIQTVVGPTCGDGLNNACYVGSVNATYILGRTANIINGQCTPAQSSLFLGRTGQDFNTGYAKYDWDENQPPDPDPDPEPNDCATRPDTVAIKAPSRNGTGNVCFAGCVVSIGIEIGGPNLFSGLHTGQACTPDAANPEPVLANPDPNANPCPNQPDGQCPGTETPENPSPGEAGGGFACDTPPVCSGSGIDCSMLYQTWRSRCASELTDAKTGEQLDGIGDSLKGIKDGLKDGLDGLGNKVDKLNDDMNRNAADTIDSQGRTTDAVNRNTNALNEGINGIRGDLESGWSDGGVKAPSDGEWGGILGSRTLGVGDLDQGGFGFPRQCPKWKDVSFSVGMSAITIPLSTFTAHCTIFEWTGVLLLAFASYYALRIVISD